MKPPAKHKFKKMPLKEPKGCREIFASLNIIAGPSADHEYFRRLTSADHKYIRKFVGEYYFNQFFSPPLHQDQEQRRKAYAANNARRRCIIPKYFALLSRRVEAKKMSADPTDALIEAIDRKRALEKLASKNKK